MKLFWVVNTPLSKFGEYLFGKPSNGVWMDALLEDFNGKKDVEIVIVTTLRTKSVKKLNDGNVTYYALPGGYPSEYNENKKRNIEIWKTLLKEEKPDLIQIWGTEFTHGLCALRAAEGSMPSVVVIQGLLCEIAKYYLAGMKLCDFYNTVTLRDVLKWDSMRLQQIKFYSNAKKEAEIIRLSKRIIGENDWCFSIVKGIEEDVKIYKCRMSINSIFEHFSWDIKDIERYSIMCNASGYTIKGLHILLHAVADLKKRYPIIKLYIPGTPVVSDGSIKWFVRKRGYTLYVEKLIKKLDISDNIVWLGDLTQQQLAVEYSKKHVFVMPSAIENQSSSLIEAMTVGIPSVASYVGGVPDYLSHNINGFLYRFDNYKLLEYYIEKIFNDDDLAKRLSLRAKEDMKIRNNRKDIMCEMIQTYEQILEEQRNT